MLIEMENSSDQQYSLYHKILWFDSSPDGRFVHLGDLQMCRFECAMVGPGMKFKKKDNIKQLYYCKNPLQWSRKAQRDCQWFMRNA